MKAFQLCLLLSNCLTAAAQFHTGFVYGAFKNTGAGEVAITYDTFKRAFERAQAITGSYHFNSARLFSSIHHGTQGSTNTPIEAFQAAIDTQTTLLLGIWIGKEGDNVKNELAALDTAFAKWGSQLADLVVGISVGSEDIYRGSSKCINCAQNGAASPGDLQRHIATVKEHFAKASYGNLLVGKPVGHVDIADMPLTEQVDFFGMNAYPLWHEDHIDTAKESFLGSLRAVEDKTGGTPVWITETGWPVSGVPRGDAAPGIPNMQRYWNEVGCSLFGKHNVWWYSFHADSSDGYDWGIFDAAGNPRIDLSCAPPKDSDRSVPASSSPAQQPVPTLPTTMLTLPIMSKPTNSSNTPVSTTTPSSSTTSTPPQGIQMSDASTAKSWTTITVTKLECVTVATLRNGTLTTKTNVVTDRQLCTTPSLVFAKPTVPVASAHSTSATPAPKS